MKRDPKSRKLCVDCGTPLPPRKRTRCSVCEANRTLLMKREWDRKQRQTLRGLLKSVAMCHCGWQSVPLTATQATAALLAHRRECSAVALAVVDLAQERADVQS